MQGAWRRGNLEVEIEGGTPGWWGRDQPIDVNNLRLAGHESDNLREPLEIQRSRWLRETARAAEHQY